MSEVIARRQFSPGYIGFDIAFLLVFAGLLLWRKKYMTALIGSFWIRLHGGGLRHFSFAHPFPDNL